MMRLQLPSGLRAPIVLRGARLPRIKLTLWIQVGGESLPFLRYSSQSAAAAVQFDHNDAVMNQPSDYIRSGRIVKNWKRDTKRTQITKESTKNTESGKRAAKITQSMKSAKKRTNSTRSTKKPKKIPQISKIIEKKSRQHVEPQIPGLPTRQEVFSMPEKLLLQPITTLKERFQGMKIQHGGVHCKTKATKEGRYTASGFAIIPGHGKFSAMADGPSQKIAEKTCGLRIVAELHRAGLVKELWPVDMMSNNREGVGQDALADVYNYCSKHMLIPEVDIVRFKPLLATKKNTQLYRYIICLKEQNILVSATGGNFMATELSAVRMFKSAAESYVAKSGTSDLLVIKNAGSLYLENAEMFHEWLRNNDRMYDYKVCSNKLPTWDVIESQLSLRSRDSNGEWVMTGPVFKCGRKTTGELIAYLHAAISQVQANPSLGEEFFAALRDGNGKILRRASPVDLELPKNSVALIHHTLSHARSSGLDVKPNFELTSVHEPEQRQRSSRPPLGRSAKHALSMALSEKYQRYLTGDGTAAMRKIRSELPMNHYKDEVCRIVEENEYSIIIGATGSGKTTQVPQIILEQYYQRGKGAECEILCTQPRRIAATSVATRVKDEMGPELQAHVGHHVRFDAKLPRQGGSVTYCTTGILLQQLQNDPDRILDQTSHLILDEVHERDKIIDFTLTILKRAVAERLAAGKKCPKVTLMSATLDTELFANYFKNSLNGVHINAPVLSVPGRTFPVTERYMDDILTDLQKIYTRQELEVMTGDRYSADYLEHELRYARDHHADSTQHRGAESVIDWKTKRSLDDDQFVSSSPEEAVVPFGLVAATIAHVARTTTEGAILVFFPGLQEMQEVEKLIQQPILGVDLLDTSKFKTFLLHSSIPATQKTVFSSVPEGVRKIILSTNIGETSITIPDVQHVIDTGKLRETRYDHVKRISSLETTWISKSNAKQRAGRAGRVQNGNYLALYSRARYESMKAIGLPEILRSDLQATCLTVKSSIRGVDIRQFLAGAVEPPNPAGVDEAVGSLVKMGAFTLNEDLTALGRVLASLPIHPALGKMIILGALFKCLDPILVIGAAAEERGLWIMVPGTKDRTAQIKKSFLQGSQSDHMVLWNAFSAVRQLYNSQNNGTWKAQAFATDNNIHFGAWRSIHGAAKQIEQILREHGLIPKEVWTDDNPGELFGGPGLNVNSYKTHVVKAILLAGLMPNLALSLSSPDKPWRTTYEEYVMLPRTSVLAGLSKEENLSANSSRTTKYLATFTNLVKSSDGNNTFLREVSTVDPLTVALFANNLQMKGNYNVLEVCGWLPLYVKSLDYRGAEREAARSLVDLRWVLECVQANAFAGLANGQPMHGTDEASQDRESVIERVVQILDMAAGDRKSSSSRSDMSNAVSDSDFDIKHANLPGFNRSYVRDGGSDNPDRLLDDLFKQVVARGTGRWRDSFETDRSRRNFGRGR